MPHIEAVDDLAEYLADQMGIYGTACDVQDCGCKDEDGLGDHSEDCKFRVCFTSEIRRRIRGSVENEARVK